MRVARRPSFRIALAAFAALQTSCKAAAFGPTKGAVPPLVAPAPGTCPTGQADEVFVADLNAPIVNMLVAGPWLFAVSGVPGGNYSATADSGEILRIDRATGRTTPLALHRGSFHVSWFAGSSFVYWTEEGRDGAQTIFRLELPAGVVEPVAGSPGCFLVDGDAYYTYLEPGGLFRVGHRGKSAHLMYGSHTPGRCAWSDSDSIVVQDPSGLHRLFLNGTEQTPYQPREVGSPRVESRADGFVLSHLRGGGAAKAVVPYSGDVVMTAVEGGRGYVAMRPVVDVPGQPSRLMKIALLGVTLDGETPAVELGNLDEFEEGFAVDECFVYYASGGDGHSIRRKRRTF
jgi:hypothetical protein